MYFGSRRIRSAGRASGSVEVTLPPQLHGLQEIKCRLMLRDGTHPEIVLQPDLSSAHTLLLQLWQKLRMGLASIGEIGDFDPSSFTLALFPHATGSSGHRSPTPTPSWCCAAPPPASPTRQSRA